MRIGVVLAGGVSTNQIVPPVVADAVAGPGAVVVAADSGLDLAEHLGIRPTLVIGDFDSVSPGALQRARESGLEVVEFPTAKDRTDLELAIAAAVGQGLDRLIVLGGAGGRLDHLLANVGALAAVPGDVAVEAWFDDQLMVVVDDRWEAALPERRTVSVLAWGGPATVSEAGVRWPLAHHRLEPGSTLGVSNESLGVEPVEISVHEGRALVVLPDAKDLT